MEPHRKADSPRSFSGPTEGAETQPSVLPGPPCNSDAAIVWELSWNHCSKEPATQEKSPTFAESWCPPCRNPSPPKRSHYMLNTTTNPWDHHWLVSALLLKETRSQINHQIIKVRDQNKQKTFVCICTCTHTCTCAQTHWRPTINNSNNIWWISKTSHISRRGGLKIMAKWQQE